MMVQPLILLLRFLCSVFVLFVFPLGALFLILN